MAADTRPFKSKEQDGQGNEVIIRDQQLVEQASQTTMASGEYFEIVDVDGRMAKIPKANMMSVVLEAIRLLLDDSGSNISAANLTKILGLSASSIGNILPTDLASVLGVRANYCNRNELAAGSSLDINCGTGFYIILNHSASTAGIYLVCGTSATITVSESQNPQFTFTSSGWKKMINNTGSATQTFTWHAITQI